MNFLLDRVDDLMITEDVLITVIVNYDFRHPRKTIGLVIERATDVTITDTVLGSAARYGSMDDGILALFWKRSHKSRFRIDVVWPPTFCEIRVMECFVFLVEQTRDIEIGEGMVIDIILN